jgi:hypothetical protein
MKKVLSAFSIVFAFSISLNAQDHADRWLANSNTTGVVQNPLNLGNWSNPVNMPQYRFFTNDQGDQNLDIRSTRDYGGLFVSRNSPAGPVNLASIRGWQTAGTILTLYNASNQPDLVLSTNGENSYINTGNFSIGTNNPQGYRLAVNGSAIFTSAKVKPFANWPDYVFDPTYSLRPLAGVEKFIQQNHHLPEVPSADEVKQDGLDLGANQAILLKKIEELTLYIIAQQKEINELKKEMKKPNR